MAAESYITYHRNGMWIQDHLMEKLLHYIVEEIDSEYSDKSWLLNSKKRYILFSQGYFPDMINLELEDKLTSNSRRNTYIQLLKRVIKTLNDKGELISVKELNEINQTSELLPLDTKPLKTDELIEVAEKIIQLINTRPVEIRS